MAKVVDITEKLSFDEDPSLMIRGQVVAVNSDAPTVLKVMGLVSKNAGMEEILQAYELIFPEEARAVLDSMKLKMKDLMVVIQEAMELVTGESEGEQ